MNVLVRTVSMVIAAILIGYGCSVTEGPRPPAESWSLHQADVKAMADCEKQNPGAMGIWDPLTGYFKYGGARARNAMKCLVDQHGWYELGPPEFAPGTMAPPRRTWP